jgi:protease secretion system membrane fusion protein
VPPQVIDRLQPGQAADIRFSAFAHSPQLVAQGRLLSVSTDLLTEAETRQSYYLARLQLTPEGLKTLGSRTLQAGMMTEVVIRTGERSLLTYLAYPLVRRLSQSMREE